MSVILFLKLMTSVIVNETVLNKIQIKFKKYGWHITMLSLISAYRFKFFVLWLRSSK